jgi:anti-sigma regulatory factor (Ser/Thr protein kinase)
VGVFEFSLPAHRSFVPLARLAVGRIATLYGLPPTQSDALRLALTELVANAVRHAYAPGHAGSFQVRVHKDSDRLVMEVIDHGSEQDRERASGRSDGLGLGMGLTIVQQLAERIDVSDTPGGGWTVRVEFPVPPTSGASTGGAA